MKLKSIKSHLKPYSIEKKRRTTIAHAFASALAPTDSFSEPDIWSALSALGQSDSKHLTCVYCKKSAQTWDHLTNLVKAGEFNGYGHQIGNLVPCCKDCNSAKGSLSFEKFVDTLGNIDDVEKTDLKVRLKNHQSLAIAFDSSNKCEREDELLKQYKAIQNNILQLLKNADQCADEIRKIRTLTLEPTDKAAS